MLSLVIILHNLVTNLENYYFTGTTDSSISEEDAVPPPLPAKHRDIDYSNLPFSNENPSFLYSNRNSALRTSIQIKPLIADTLDINFDDSDVPPIPPPKPPKIKNQTIS